MSTMRRFVFSFALIAVGSFTFDFVASGGVARAGAINPVLSVGDKAPEWKDLPGVDGKKHSLADLKSHDFVVVCFTCNSCDVAKDYEDRIIALAKKYADAKAKVAFVAVNVNKIPADNLAAMKKRADEKKFPYAYLYDDSQKVAKDYGATSTPEFFVLDKNRKIAYMGGFDDHSTAKLAKQKFLETALDSIVKGQKPKTAETAAIGCLIRYERERRKKTETAGGNTPTVAPKPATTKEAPKTATQGKVAPVNAEAAAQ